MTIKTPKFKRGDVVVLKKNHLRLNREVILKVEYDEITKDYWYGLMRPHFKVSEKFIDQYLKYGVGINDEVSKI